MTEGAPSSAISLKQILFSSTVLVSALGYFVDIYDLVLFSIVRVASLKDLGVTGPEQLAKGVELLDMQMIGMLLGGLIWGILGDKRGRLSVLLGSILLYSAANLANAFVSTLSQYAILRFLAGVGLAGELGAAITLVSECLPRESRGYGTCIVAGIGVSGAIFAALVAELFSWRIAFMIGGVMGLALLLSRFRLSESKMFHQMSESSAPKGDLWLIVKSWPRFIRYLRCIVVGIPTWYCIGILVTFSPEICQALGATGPVSAGQAILACYSGIVTGDLISGFLGQWWRNRKRVVAIFLAATTLAILGYLSATGLSPLSYYWLCFGLGVATGYWAVFLTMAAEQFGTNLRATVAISVPNFVRGSVVLLTYVFRTLTPHFDLKTSALILGFLCIAAAYTALFGMRESFGLDLNYFENP